MEPAKPGPGAMADTQSTKELPTDVQRPNHPGTNTGVGPAQGSEGAPHRPEQESTAPSELRGIPCPLQPESKKLLRVTLNIRYRLWPARGGANTDKTLQHESREPWSRGTGSSSHPSDAGPCGSPCSDGQTRGTLAHAPHPLALQPV